MTTDWRPTPPLADLIRSEARVAQVTGEQFVATAVAVEPYDTPEAAVRAHIQRLWALRWTLERKQRAGGGA
jgi:hypothetical protein